MKDYYNKIEINRKKENFLKIEFIFKIYFLFGIITSIFGLLHLTLNTQNIHLTIEQKLGIVITLVGFITSLASYALLNMQKLRRSLYDEDSLKYKDTLIFIETWNLFESLAKDIAYGRTKNHNHYSIREALKKLYSQKKIDEKDLNVLENALLIRNGIVHDNRKLSNSDIEVLSKLTKIIKCLE